MTFARICTSVPEIFGKLHKSTGTLAVDGFDFAEKNDVRMEASYSYTATKGICKASSCAVGSPMSAGRRIRVQSFVLATVSVTVSLGAKPAQAERRIRVGSRCARNRVAFDTVCGCVVYMLRMF